MSDTSQKNSQSNGQNTKQLQKILAAFTLFLIIAIGLYGLGPSATALLIAFVLAYLFFPVILKLESHGIPRAAALVAVSLGTVVFWLVVGVLFLPSLYHDFLQLIHEAPRLFSLLLEKLEEYSSSFGFHWSLERDEIVSWVSNQSTELKSALQSKAFTIAKGAVTNLSHWIVTLLSFVFIPMFLFYIIMDYEKITKELHDFIPTDWQPQFHRYFELSNTILSGYLRGQLLVALIMASLYAVGLYISGLPYGILIGVISGLICIIPYAGFLLGFSTALIMSFVYFDGWFTPLGVVATFVAVQAVEGTLITPNLVGDKVGLSPLITILALIVGGNLFGLAGMVLAIPVAAILKTLIYDLRHQLD